MKIIQSRNKREGYYAGYYPAYIDYEQVPTGANENEQYIAHLKRGKHCRWSAWCMSEFYPRIRGVYWPY